MKRAIVRIPASTLKDGLTTANLGAPDYQVALAQHGAHCVALERCGVQVIVLEADPDFPDSTFVEDTAVLTQQCAILSNPGAVSRRGEVDLIARTLKPWFQQIARIEEPGTLDGGDVCEAGNHYFIGISERTNQAGAEQLSRHLNSLGCSSSFIDIRSEESLLHLKSGIAWLGNQRLVVTDALASHKEFANYELVRVEPEEEYATNCVRINNHLLIAQGYPKLAATLVSLGYQTIPLEMTEFQKMDGGLSCLSLRF